MIKKIIGITLMFVYVVFGLTACIERESLRSARAMTNFVTQEYLTGIEVELVSHERTTIPRRAEYVFRDENGIEFTIIEEIHSYSFAFHRRDHSHIYSNYARRLLEPHIEEITTIFESIGFLLEVPVEEEPNVTGFNALRGDSIRVQINSFEQIPDIATAFENSFNLVPKMPFRDTDWALGIELRFDGGHIRGGMFRFPIVGEDIPDWHEIHISIENVMADYFKLNPDVDLQIPHEVLMIESPSSFNSTIMVVNGVEVREFRNLITMRDGQHILPSSIFYASARFSEMIRALGGSSESVRTDTRGHVRRWEISGNEWEAYRTDEGANIIKNGVFLTVLENPERPTLRDLEMLLGVRAHYTNDVAILYLILDE